MSSTKNHSPEDLEALRQAYIKIRQGKDSRRFGARTMAALEQMLNEPHETAIKSISEIAQEHGISTSSLTRMAQRMGFNGFPGLRALFEQNLRQRKGFYSKQVENFLQRKHVYDNTESDLLGQIIQDEWSNVMFMFENFEDERFAATIDLIVKAKRVTIIGLRSSYLLAYYLGFYLRLIRDAVSTAGQAGHTLAEDLSLLHRGDLLIAISLKPYTKNTVDACRIARKQKVDIVAITDSVSSPLASETNNFLITPVEKEYFFTPIAAAIIGIETILSAVVKRLGEQASRKLKHTEYILEKMEIET